MKRAFSSVVLSAVLCACSTTQPEKASTRQTSKLDTYFERYCDQREEGDDANGPGWPVYVEEYGHKFRQRLKMTRDKELKRLYVLRYLYPETASDIYRFKEGMVIVDLATRRQMTKVERAELHAKILEDLRNLAEFDPGDPLRQIAEFTDDLREAEAKHLH